MFIHYMFVLLTVFLRFISSTVGVATGEGLIRDTVAPMVLSLGYLPLSSSLSAFWPPFSLPLALPSPSSLSSPISRPYHYIYLFIIRFKSISQFNHNFVLWKPAQQLSSGIVHLGVLVKIIDLFWRSVQYVGSIKLHSRM